MTAPADRAFLGRLLTEETRLLRALVGVRNLIPIYEKLIEADAMSSRGPSEEEVARIVSPAPERADTEPRSGFEGNAVTGGHHVTDPTNHETDRGVVPRATNGAPSESGRGALDIDASRMWTDERLAVMRADYPTAKPTLAIQAALNARPGRFISADRIAVQAGRMGIRRPPEGPQSKPPIGPSSTEPVAADFTYVVRWAAERGITIETWDDLPMANAKRLHLGQPIFKREFPVPGRSA